MRKGICNNLVFYNLQTLTQQEVKAWYNYAIQWFDQYSQSPNRATIAADDLPQGKTKTFKYCNRVLQQRHFINVNGIWIASVIPEADLDMNDYTFGADFNFNNESWMMFSFDNSILGFSPDIITFLAKDLIRYFSPAYGIAYQRDFDKGPSLYANGMLAGKSNSDEEDDEISKWMHMYGDPKRYRVGDLRDVYPYNFLSHAHLARQVGTHSLQEWINACPDRGRLSPLNAHLWVWEVPQEQIPTIREALRPHEMLICFRDALFSYNNQN